LSIIVVVQATAAPQLTIDPASYVVVSSAKIRGQGGKTFYDYTLTAEVVNAGTTAAINVTGIASTTDPATEVLDDTLTFPGLIQPGARVRSSDTFLVRQEGSRSGPIPPFDPTSIAWTIDFQDAGSNTPPVANAGPDQTVYVGQTVTLDGGASTDAEGDPLSYAWSFVNSPTGSAATLSNPAAVRPTFLADTEGEYVLQLLVNDGVAAPYTSNSALVTS
jgi:hypothetical protein